MGPYRSAPLTPSGPRRRLPLILAVFAMGWGGDDAVAPDPRVSPLVGDGAATSLVLTHPLNPKPSADLTATGATFHLNLQPQGQHSAILVLQAQSRTQIGQVTVDGDRWTLEPAIPAAQPSPTGTYAIQGAVLTPDGATEFDFNSDGTAEPATVHMDRSAQSQRALRARFRFPRGAIRAPGRIVSRETTPRPGGSRPAEAIDGAHHPPRPTSQKGGSEPPLSTVDLGTEAPNPGVAGEPPP